MFPTVYFVKKNENPEQKLKEEVKHACNSYINAANNVCKTVKNKKFHETLEKLSKDSEIKVTNFDKGNGIVILNSDDYISKLDQIVSDTTKFEDIKSTNCQFCEDPVVKNEGKLCRYLKKYVKPHVSSEIYDDILPCGSQPGKLYGMAKIHKDGCPLRPVVSMIGTAEYKLAKYLDNLIKPNIPNQYMLGSTNELLSVLDNFEDKINENQFMVSFDVVSLFTNVPLDKSIDIAADYVYSEGNQNKPAYSKDIFKQLLKFATGGIFAFNGRYLKQIDGVTMGSPLGPTLANIFLADMEKEWMKVEFAPLLYRRYVDDIICVFDANGKYNNFFNLINQGHPNIKFTCEFGDKNIPFLDVNIIMSESTFDTSIFRKPTYTGLLLNFNAMCPVTWKKGLVIGLLNRAYVACSSWISLHVEIDKITNFLIANSYPRHFIDNIVNKFLEMKVLCKRNNKEDNERNYCFKIPYVGNPSLVLKKKLVKIFKKSNIKINVIFSTTKVSSYFSLKDRSNPSLKASVVYHFKCLEDPSLTYIGKTKRYLQTRVTEHSKGDSAIYSHLVNCNTCKRNSDNLFNQFSVLHNGNSDFDLHILEAFYIFDKRPCLNKQLSTSGMSYNLNVF